MKVIIELYKKILKILNSPHTLTYDLKSILLQSAGMSLLIYIVLFLFYTTNSALNFSTSQLLLIFFSYLLTFSISSTHLYLLTHIAPEIINESNWTTIKEIISIIVLLILISVGNYFLAVHWDQSELTLSSYFYIVLNTFKIGIIPIIVGVLIEKNRRLKKYLESAITLNSKLENLNHEDNIDDVMSVVDENNNPAINFKLSNLVCIKSAGNYVEVHLIKNGIIKPTLLRSSLKKIEDQFSSLDGILKCHRMYLVNIMMISYAEGNSQGYKLFTKEGEYEIPVSRNYIKNLKNRITSMQLV